MLALSCDIVTVITVDTAIVITDDIISVTTSDKVIVMTVDNVIVNTINIVIDITGDIVIVIIIDIFIVNTIDIAIVITLKKFRNIPYIIISVGGEVPGEDRSSPFQDVLRYCMDSHKFEVEALTDLSEVHTSPGLDIGYKISVKGKDIIFTGGETKFGKNTWIIDVWKYDTFSHQWEVITKLQNVRRHHGMCIMGDCIYLIGGFGKYRMKLDSVEMFNCKTGKWSTLASLPEPAFSLAATVCNGKIYAIKSRVYCYDPQEDRWKIDNGDPPPFICSDALTYGQYIYLPSRYCSRLTRYDTTSNTFEEVGVFPHSKGAGSSVICDGKIYRVGISEFKAFMEWYDIEKDIFNSAQELDLFLLNNNLVSVPYIKDFR
ncbi:hypothetical protein KUTeg_024627 [Tegillarca granosa]|uniref:Uncharacterized protein n=1 Tax=Tegillarca granosa TaxID=220873 RepID=A0ABQ9E0X3_TEGGR|nr:hypothetical protein KUTeg_024627 [Tegillarca granosa]